MLRLFSESLQHSDNRALGARKCVSQDELVSCGWPKQAKPHPRHLTDRLCLQDLLSGVLLCDVPDSLFLGHCAAAGCWQAPGPQQQEEASGGPQ